MKGGNFKDKNVGSGKVSKAINSVDYDDEYAFTVSGDEKLNSSGLIDITVGRVVIDSGSSCNIVDKDNWEILRRKGVQLGDHFVFDRKIHRQRFALSYHFRI